MNTLSDGGAFVEPEALVCPGCGEQVRCEHPANAHGSDAGDEEFSHRDGSALCSRADGAACDPVELAGTA
jgi:hypothetical protein